MIQPQELRIGNYIEYNGEIIKLDGSLLCCYIQNELEFPLNPIPLTEEILLKLGFKYRKKNSKVIMLGLTNEEYETTLQSWITTNFFQICRCGINVLSVEIKYVHQLQNFFFALSGEELTFKN